MNAIEVRNLVLKLITILDAELTGSDVDHAEAMALVQRIRRSCPSITITLDNIASRMAQTASS